MPGKIKAQPLLLTNAVTAAGLAFHKLDSEQLILVLARDRSAELRCYDKENAAWRLNEALGVIAGFTGRNGISASKKEGDGCTPAGLFSLGHAFGVQGRPNTKMVYRKISADSCWVDDPASPHYNTWVEGALNAGWQSAERLFDYPREYAYAVVIEYNTAERIPGNGSAVFLHCGSKPTSGCIAVPESDLLRILKWLDPEKRPAILISAT